MYLIAKMCSLIVHIVTVWLPVVVEYVVIRRCSFQHSTVLLYVYAQYSPVVRV